MALGAIVAREVIAAIVERGLARVRKAKNLPIKDDTEQQAVREALMDEAEKELASREKFATNSESPLKSPVTLGSVMGFVGASVGIYQLYTDGVVNTWDDYSPHAMIVGGALFALWGRWFAKKPLGE
jgi:hypothetical protein